MRLRYTKRARPEIREVLDFLVLRLPGAASKSQARLRRALDLACRHPGIGRRTDEPGISRLLVRPYPYHVFYEATGRELIVHAVRHGARRPQDAVG